MSANTKKNCVQVDELEAVVKQLNAYLFFAGKAKNALDFYQNCFGGEVSAQTYADANMDIADDFKDHIMHAELVCENICLMMSDGFPGQQTIIGNNVWLSLDFNRQDEQQKVFDALCREGEVIRDLETTFWNARFGQVKDKFGVCWMLNCNL